MELWLKISLLLCTFGFFKEIRPSEFYVTHYLVGPWKNLTQEQVLEEIYPVGTYSHFGLLVVVFLVTDMLRYKPVIVAEGLMGVAIWSLLLWGQGVPVMQLVQVLYGGFMAAEIAYYTYIYSRVPRDRFQAVSAHARAAYLLGRFVSAVAAQALVSTELMDYRELNFITLGAMIVATAWALLLPSATSSLYFHRPAEDEAVMASNKNETQMATSSQVFIMASEEPRACSDAPATRKQWLRESLLLIRRDLRAAYTREDVRVWSVWWAFATCGFYQVLNYSQMLWEEIIADTDQTLYNGGVEAVYTIIGVLFALAVGALRLDWSILGAPVLSICCLTQGVSMFVAAQTSNLWVAYACYIVCLVAYQTLATIASAEIAKRLPEDSYALIFGMNMFIALAMQSILTAVVLNALQLAPRDQFMVYGTYFCVHGARYIGVTIVGVCRGDWDQVSHKSLWLPKPSSGKPKP